ncbi:MAG: redoxin domain-containing protein [Longimonas sp.]|uniref:redoxin domain-containing protein n=1 Tax=Longimonas sp. TaxID=2039626 RepID=UPI0039747662
MPTFSEGDPAPDFTLFTQDIDPFTLSEHRGYPVVLLFFPGAFTSVCTNEMNTVNNDLASFGVEQGVTVVGISTDSPFVLDEYRKVNNLTFDLLSDHDAEVAAAYGAKYDYDFTPMELDRIAKRSAFVVDAEGTIRYAEVLENAGKQPDFEAIQATVDELVG